MYATYCHVPTGHTLERENNPPWMQGLTKGKHIIEQTEKKLAVCEIYLCELLNPRNKPAKYCTLKWTC